MSIHVLFKQVSLLLALAFIFAQKCQSQLSLHFEEFGLDFKPAKCNDTMTFNSLKKYPNYSLKLFLIECGGRSFFELYDHNQNIRMSGYYVNGIDTLQQYKFVKIIRPPHGTQLYRVYPIKYLYPLKKGSWCFYDPTGRKVKTITYDFEYGN